MFDANDSSARRYVYVTSMLADWLQNFLTDTIQTPTTDSETEISFALRP